MPKHDDLTTIVRLYIQHYRPGADRDLVIPLSASAATFS
jgi:hypothetical protein